MFGLAEINRMNADEALAVEATSIGTLTEAQATIETLQRAVEDAQFGHGEDCVSSETYADAVESLNSLVAEIGRLTERLEEALDPTHKDMALRYELADIRAWADFARP